MLSPNHRIAVAGSPPLPDGERFGSEAFLEEKNGGQNEIEQ
jgi:hypothetical protein